jgi:predicted transposase YbfD/YdcC
VSCGRRDSGRKHGFAGLAAIGEVTRMREVDGKRQEERCLYVLSRAMSASDLLAVVRRHWDVENGLHWQLDVVFREDDCRTRRITAPKTLRCCGASASILYAPIAKTTPCAAK